jgi:hypothetical protein
LEVFHPYLHFVLGISGNNLYGGCSMKLLDTNTTIAQIGSSQESQFKMKTSRKAFQILSDLYSDKPLAIVRELGCNASDSMVAAGKADRPFLIHVPNALEPYLTIQDFGTGISHENIYNIYATYFESTKTNTNDQIGCLGLGSKSPFCYTDNFLVTSIHEGVKNIYNAFFNESNTPAIALMSTSPTTEENGVAIQIPVKKDDFGSFYNAIKKSFRFFSIKPIIKGGTIDWNNEKPIFIGKGWESYETFHQAESYAIMGGVSYHIDIHKVADEHYDFIRRGGLVMYFGMGELDFTPSRESLSYCPDTIKALNDKLTFAFKNLQEKMSDDVNKATNLFDAIQQVFQLKQKFEYLANLNFDKLTWKGINVSNPAKLISDMSKAGVATHSYINYGRNKYRESVHVSFNQKAIWYYDDLPKGTLNRVKGVLKNSNDSVLCVFTMDAYKEMTSNKNPDLSFDKSRFLPTSSLPIPTRVAGSGGGGGNTRAKGVFNVYGVGDRWKSAWEGRQFDANKIPKYYVVKDVKTWATDIKIPGLTYSFRDKSQLNNLCDVLNLQLAHDVVMVSPTNEKNLKAHGSKCLAEYAKSKLKFDNINVDDLATIKKYGTHKFHNFVRAKGFDKIDKADPLVVFINKYHQAEKSMEKFGSLISGIDISKGKALEFTSKNPLHTLLFNKIGNYGWGNEDIITILQNIKN